MSLTQDQIVKRLATLPDWQQKNQTISNQFELPDFKKAIEFTNEIADASENADHHPDILIHNWNKVSVTLTTHSEGGLTIKDFLLAKKISDIFCDFN